MRNSFVVVVLLSLVVACSSKKKEAPTPGGSGTASESQGSASEPKGSGSAASGSSAAGSGSSAGSDTTAGSGSGATGSGDGSAAGSAAGSGDGSAAGGGSGSAAFDFEKLTHEQKMDFMKKQVVPTMKPLFQDFDKKKYANFGCKTCHGKNPQKAKYKMPNSSLPKLDFAALKAGKQEPEIAKWMGEVVKPQMAKLLQQPEMTEANPKGFGCLECHEQKK